MARRTLPPAERVTARDVLQLLLAATMVPLGVVIVVRVWSVSPSALGTVVGLAFVAFGVYRLWLGGTRLLDLYRRKRA